MGQPLQMPVVFSWEVGLCIVLVGCVLIFVGARKSEAEVDLNNLPLFTPLTHYFVGAIAVLFGLVQIAPSLMS